MQITIIPSDAFISIDGRGFNAVDMSLLEPGIHAIQYNTNTNTGHIELAPDAGSGPVNIDITSTAAFDSVIAQWQALADAEDNPPPPTVAAAALEQKQALYEACRKHITGGVSSTALGAPHTYPTTETDQINLSGCVTESLLNEIDSVWVVPFWCADSNDAWDRLDHTHDQIRQVGADVADHVRTAQNKLKQLADQVSTIAADIGLTDDQKRPAIAAVIW